MYVGDWAWACGRRWRGRRRSGAGRRRQQQHRRDGREEVVAGCSSRARGGAERDNYWNM